MLAGFFAMSLLFPRLDPPGTSWRQFGWWQPWTDVRVAGEWRCQRHALDGTGRLLGPGGREEFRGAARDAAIEFDRRVAAGEIAVPPGKTVLVLHGVLRNRNSMMGTVRRLKEAGYVAYGLDYACTHRPVEDHGDALRELIAHLPATTEIHLVCHSMGGLVARSCLSKDPDPRIKRVVMLGTPNQGAEKADFFGDWLLYQGLFGPAGQDLKTTGIATRLPPLPRGVEVGVVAGGLEQKLGGLGMSPFLPRDNDGIVSVDHAKLPGMQDFMVVPVQHTMLPWSKRVQDATLRFLEAGRFAAAP